jgi:hypothetical protein
VELIASGSAVTTGLAAGSTAGSATAEDSECPKEELSVGVSARTDMVLLTTVNAETLSSKETSLKDILFTVTPRKSHHELKKAKPIAHFLGFWLLGN